MRCEGTVRNKDGFDTLFAALTHLHDDHAKKLCSAGYVLQCTGCFVKFKLGGASMNRCDPCEVHAGGAITVLLHAQPLFPSQDHKRLGNLVG
jgi:hypothetical protein